MVNSGWSAGNYGVGALLVDPDGELVVRGQNRAFYPRFRSDQHAEMVVLNEFESRHPSQTNMRGFTLLTSLEPCPMCLGRLLIAGVETVKYVAPDDLGGMVGYLDRMPAAFRRLCARQEDRHADVSPELQDLASQAFRLNRDRLRARLWSR